jgi:hypothetical protein
LSKTKTRIVLIKRKLSEQEAYVELIKAFKEKDYSMFLENLLPSTATMLSYKSSKFSTTSSHLLFVAMETNYCYEVLKKGPEGKILQNKVLSFHHKA